MWVPRQQVMLSPAMFRTLEAEPPRRATMQTVLPHGRDGRRALGATLPSPPSARSIVGWSGGRHHFSLLVWCREAGCRVPRLELNRSTRRGRGSSRSHGRNVSLFLASSSCSCEQNAIPGGRSAMLPQEQEGSTASLGKTGSELTRYDPYSSCLPARIVAPSSSRN
jgi:hypothetical protein